MAYDKRKDSAERSAKASLHARDIGEIPAVVNAGRRKQCRLDLKLFLQTYHAETFNIPFSKDQDRFIERLQRVILTGGLSAIAMPRGGGKTTISQFAAQWAMVYGHRMYVFLIGATDAKAVKILVDLKTSFETNDLLLEDFPEVCFPIRKLERISKRCQGQLCLGVPTRIEWGNDRLVLPMIEGSPASGAIVVIAGLTGALRGEKTLRPDGSVIRPDFVIPDDPQTAESAKSVEQCKDRLSILTGDVLGLAGPRQKIAAVMPCTVIRLGDVADTILDRQKHPEWQGQRTRMVNSFPPKDSEASRLWDQYAEIRRESLRCENDGREATEFYARNREVMDDGFEVTWPERFDPGEISAQQNAMNLRIDRGDHVFFAEYNNEPLEDDNDAFRLTTDIVCSKINMRNREAVPLSSSKLVAFIDVQQECLFYVVCAVDLDFSLHAVDYGTWPDQKRRVFTRRELPHTLSDMYPQLGREARIHLALVKLCEILLPKEWLRDDRTIMRIDRCLIDANWGQLTKTVYEFCRTCKWPSVIMPSHGKFIGASGVPMGNWKRKAGEAIGDNWIVAGATKNRFLRHIVFDTNHWKSFLSARLMTSRGDPGCMTLFGSKPSDHHLLAEHCVSEFAVKVEGKGRKVEEWKLRTEKPDNDFWDCLVGCCVAASHIGAVLRTIKSPAKASRIPRKPREAMYL